MDVKVVSPDRSPFPWCRQSPPTPCSRLPETPTRITPPLTNPTAQWVGGHQPNPVSTLSRPSLAGRERDPHGKKQTVDTPPVMKAELPRRAALRTGAATAGLLAFGVATADPAQASVEQSAKASGQQSADETHRVVGPNMLARADLFWASAFLPGGSNGEWTSVIDTSYWTHSLVANGSNNKVQIISSWVETDGSGTRTLHSVVQNNTGNGASFTIFVLRVGG